jgi:hypothetical protein
MQYRPDQAFELFNSERTDPENVVKITVIEPTDVGYGKFSQSVRARVLEGPPHILRKEVFVKFYDPLYINPDDIKTICIFNLIEIHLLILDPETDPGLDMDSSTPPGLSSSDGTTSSAETLASSLELSRKKPISSMEGRSLAGVAESVSQKSSDETQEVIESIASQSLDNGTVENEPIDQVQRGLKHI